MCLYTRRIFMENKDSEKDKQKFNVTVNLLLKYYHGKASAAETHFLQQWLDQNEENKVFLENITNEKKLQKELQIFNSLDMHAAWQNVAARTTKQKKTFNFWAKANILKYAASVALLAIIGAAFFLIKKDTVPTELISFKALPVHQDTLPGSNKTTLTFADGSFVVLQDQKNGVIKEYNGVKIIKLDEEIIFKSDNTPETNFEGNNIISTPKGAQYKIVLLDGSKVWLNAASTISFPTVFTQKERVVELKGEGYFEIAKNALKPFKVKANKTIVSVLGTHFNIMAYANEETTNTTLLEGSVKVCAGNASQVLLPGQQAKVKDNIEVTEVDLEEAIAWKNGNFQFNNTELGMIMRQIERWYNVKVDFKGQVAEKHFTGVISRDIAITKVLKMLELSGDINFTIEERRIIVAPNAGS